MCAEALYLVEGAGQVGLGLSWGDGYAHHRALLDSAKAVSDPSDFFDSLVRLFQCCQRHSRSIQGPFRTGNLT
jgi:hypothetical protein